MEEQHHTNIIQSLSASSDNIQGASASCGFNLTEVLRTTSLSEHVVNYQLKNFYFSHQKMLRNKWHAVTMQYIRKEIIPQGLGILKSSSFGKDNPAFITGFSTSIYFALMAITIQLS